MQEAFGRAAARWPVEGVPDEPAAWMIATAGNVAIDRLRRDRTLAAKLPQLERAGRRARPGPPGRPPSRRPPRADLRLLPPGPRGRGQVALTLRLVGRPLDGRDRPRLPRPRARDGAAAGAGEAARSAWPASAFASRRAPPGRPARPRDGRPLPDLQRGLLRRRPATPVRHDLCDESIRLARMLVSLLPGEPEPAGLLALMLFHHARAAARIGGRRRRRSCSSDQDRRLWDADAHPLGRDRDRTRRGGRVGRRAYRLQAAIAGEHVRAATAAETDWQAVAALYAELAAVAPSPVVDLNHAVAVSMSEGPEAGLVRRRPPRGIRGRSTATTSCTPPGRTCCAGSAEAPRRSRRTARARARARRRPSARSSPRRDADERCPHRQSVPAQHVSLSAMARKIPSSGPVPGRHGAVRDGLRRDLVLALLRARHHGGLRALADAGRLRRRRLPLRPRGGGVRRGRGHDPRGGRLVGARPAGVRRPGRGSSPGGRPCSTSCSRSRSRRSSCPTTSPARSGSTDGSAVSTAGRRCARSRSSSSSRSCGMLRRTDVYTIGVLVAALDLVVQVETGGASGSCSCSRSSALTHSIELGTMPTWNSLAFRSRSR